VKKAFGYIISFVAWLVAVSVVCCWAVYAISVVVWLHAPVPMVLAVTLPIMLVILGVAWMLNKGGAKLRR